MHTQEGPTTRQPAMPAGAKTFPTNQPCPNHIPPAGLAGASKPGMQARHRHCTLYRLTHASPLLVGRACGPGAFPAPNSRCWRCSPPGAVSHSTYLVQIICRRYQCEGKGHETRWSMASGGEGAGMSQKCGTSPSPQAASCPPDNNKTGTCVATTPVYMPAAAKQPAPRRRRGGHDAATG